MQSRFFNGFVLAFAWLLVSVAVFSAIDAYATREIPLRVEDYRRAGMTDEEVVAAVVREASRMERNAWWIHDKEPLLVFDTSRTYHFDPSGMMDFVLEITTQASGARIGRVHQRP